MRHFWSQQSPSARIDRIRERPIRLRHDSPEETVPVATMIDALRQASERAAGQSEEEQTALAARIMQMLDADARWEVLFADPLTPQALDELAAEAIAEDDAVRRGKHGA